MAKILLVEDDNNLREIYGERLMAEGYEIVSAADGEEALQTAVSEKPDLIISDVMMPKISGFDMLDILRQTPETKNVKIIMMTALSQAEDKARADKLGADKYLVKSQVTLEDVARVVHTILEDGPTEEEPAEQADAEQPATAAPEAPSSEPITPVIAPSAVIEPTVDPPATPEPVAPVAEPTTPPAMPDPIAAPVAADPVVAAPAPEPATSPAADPAAPAPVATPEPVAPVAVPDPVVAPVAADPVVAAPVEPVAANPISGDDAVTLPSNEQSTADTSQAASVASEESEVTNQIENFIAKETETSNHTEPLKDPTTQEAVAAKTADAQVDPKILTPEKPVNNATIPPVIPKVDPKNPHPVQGGKKIISPIHNDSNPETNINALYEQEMADEAATATVTTPDGGAIQAPTPQPAEDNPIQGMPEEATPAPLEALDATQIPGVEDITAVQDAVSKPEQLPAQDPQIVTDPTPETIPAPTPESNPVPTEPEQPPANEEDPLDPSNIAL